jgi:hypothetical protein
MNLGKTISGAYSVKFLIIRAMIAHNIAKFLIYFLTVVKDIFFYYISVKKRKNRQNELL